MITKVRVNIARTKINIFWKMTFIRGSVYSGVLGELSGIHLTMFSDIKI